MGVNKVDLANGETLINLTSDTVTPQTLAKGVTAHNSEGKEIIGNLLVGDMFKNQYDKDNNGQVDKADDADTVGGKHIVVSSSAPTSNDTTKITIVI